MWTRVILSLCGLLVLAASASSNPFVCDDAANRCTYRVTLTEPTKMVSGAALSTLHSITIKTALNSGNFVHDVHPATAPTGGGQILQDYTFATTACAVTTFTAKASATNALGIEGPDSPPVTVTRDRTLDPTCAPAAPVVKVE